LARNDNQSHKYPNLKHFQKTESADLKIVDFTISTLMLMCVVICMSYRLVPFKLSGPTDWEFNMVIGIIQVLPHPNDFLNSMGSTESGIEHQQSNFYPRNI
jgi:hypothetical protein